MNLYLIKYNLFNYDKNYKKCILVGNNSVDIEVDKFFFFIVFLIVEYCVLYCDIMLI